MIEQIAYRSGVMGDRAAVIALNEDVVEQTSPMDDDRFDYLTSNAKYFQLAEQGTNAVGFILCFDENAEYDSVHYRWFKSRIRQFIYVDRVVVASSARGNGVGANFYHAAIEFARANDCHWLAAEINLQPANPGSMGFHKSQGFVEVATLRHDRNKQVSLQLLAVQ